MIETGTVVALKKKYAVVRVKRHAGCENCNACGLGKKKDFIDLELINDAKSKVGDLVEISMESIDVVKVVGIIYLVPLILAAIGLFIAMKLNLKEVYQLIISIGALLLSFVLIYLSDKYFRKKGIMPRVIRVINNREIG